VRVFKLKTFARWARREGLADRWLEIAVREMQHGLIDANLGGGLLKKRVARAGGGKRGGYRTLVAADLAERWIFLYGFAKNERENLDESQVRELRRLAKLYLAFSEAVVDRLVYDGELIEVRHGESETS
jgi:hypothetical protein